MTAVEYGRAFPPDGRNVLQLLQAKRVLVVMQRAVVDVVLSVPDIPADGEKVLIESVNVTPGGVEGNFASAMAFMGASVTAVGCRSDDAYGAIDDAALRSSGVDCRWDDANAGPSTVCYVLVDQAGERAIAISYPPDPASIASGVERAVTAASGEQWDVVYLGVLRSLHRSVMETVSRLAPLVAVTLELSDWQADWLDDAAARLDLVFVADETYAAKRDVIERLADRHGWILVVTRGGHGSSVRWLDGEASARAASLGGRIRDTTGAGDAFAAAFTAAWLVGRRGTDALEIASRFAAAKIQRIGPRAFAQAQDLFGGSVDAQTD